MNRMDNQKSFFQSHKWLIIVLLIVAVLALGSESSEDKMDDSFKPSGEINNIKVITGNADVKINTGDAFYVEGKNLIKDNYEFKQEGDTLKVIYKNHFNFINFSFWEKAAQITITVPTKNLNTLTVDTGSGSFITNTSMTVTESKFQIGSGDVELDTYMGKSLIIDIGSGCLNTKDITVDTMEVGLGSGDANCGYLETNTVKLSVGSGEFNFKSLTAGSCKADIGSGDFKGRNVKVVNMTGEVGSGSIELAGELTGVSKLSCGSGDIDLKLSGNVDEYYLDLDGEDIEINNVRYKKKYKSQEVLDKQLILDCGSGNIDVTIH